MNQGPGTKRADHAYAAEAVCVGRAVEWVVGCGVEGPQGAHTGTVAVFDGSDVRILEVG